MHLHRHTVINNNDTWLHNTITQALQRCRHSYTNIHTYRHNDMISIEESSPFSIGSILLFSPAVGQTGTRVCHTNFLLSQSFGKGTLLFQLIRSRGVTGAVAVSVSRIKHVMRWGRNTTSIHERCGIGGVVVVLLEVAVHSCLCYINNRINTME